MLLSVVYRGPTFFLSFILTMIRTMIQNAPTSSPVVADDYLAIPGYSYVF